MKLKLKIESDFDDDPNLAMENQKELVLTIHKKFPNAVWEKANQGYQIFI